MNAFVAWLRLLFRRRGKVVTPFARYALVGWRIGEEVGRIPMVVRSLSWAEVECKRLNAEALQDVVWHIAEIEPDVAIYGRTGLEDE